MGWGGAVLAAGLLLAWWPDGRRWVAAALVGTAVGVGASRVWYVRWWRRLRDGLEPIWQRLRDLGVPLPEDPVQSPGEIRARLQRVGDFLTSTVTRMRAESRLVRSILEAMREGVMAVDRDGRIVLVNSGMQRLGGFSGSALGMAPGEVLGASELVEAIEAEDREGICEESGDLLLQVVFLAQLAREEAAFTLEDVLEGIIEKLVVRHPHVFGDVIAETPEEVSRNWEIIKSRKRREGAKDDSALAGVPRSLPALHRALRLQERAAKVGFDWEPGDETVVLAKIQEEARELEEATREGTRDQALLELGDMLASHEGERTCLILVKRMVAGALKGHPHDAERRNRVMSLKSWGDLREFILAWPL